MARGFLAERGRFIAKAPSVLLDEIRRSPRVVLGRAGSRQDRISAMRDSALEGAELFLRGAGDRGAINVVCGCSLRGRGRSLPVWVQPALLRYPGHMVPRAPGGGHRLREPWCRVAPLSSTRRHEDSSPGPQERRERVASSWGSSNPAPAPAPKPRTHPMTPRSRDWADSSRPSARCGRTGARGVGPHEGAARDYERRGGQSSSRTRPTKRAHGK